jgi:putative hydrolase
VQLEADLHTHTVASGHAYSTVKEMVDAALKKGLKLLAITDHGPHMPGAPHFDYFFNTLVWPRKINGIQVLRGVEANILNTEGQLDLPEELLESLDIVLAGLHASAGYQGSTKEENTQALVAAISNPYVNIITHPGNPQFPVDFERVVLAAREYGKALEINNSSFLVRPQSNEPCLHIAKLAKKHGVTVAVDSDAHICYGVGECTAALEIARQAGIEASQLLNSSAEQVREFLVRQGRAF